MHKRVCLFLIFSMISLLVYCQAIGGQVQRKKTVVVTNKTTNRPLKKILYSLTNNEVLSYGECMLSFKSDGLHFGCITTNLSKSQYDLIIDGKKVITAEKIVVKYLDPSIINNSVFYYKKNNQWFFYIEGKTFGPYYGENAYNSVGWDVDNWGWIEKGWYEVFNNVTKKWNAYYYGKLLEKRHLYINRMYSKNFSIPEIISMNNNYKVLSNEFGTIIFNGSFHRIIPVQEYDETWRQDVSLLEDGQCVVGFYHRDHPYREFVFYNGEIKELSQEQFFNFKTGRVETGEKSYGIFTQSFYTLEFGSYRTQQRIIFDKTKKHKLETCGLYNYVLIDNKKFGKDCAIYINYHKKFNEFQWIALEGNDLVLYRFQL